MKKLSRSERKHIYRLLCRAKRTINRYGFANIFTDPIPDEQKVAFLKATIIYNNCKKMLLHK